MTWCPSVSGQTIELVEPIAEQVDFKDLAWSLAHTIRYGGHGFTPVSVGHHTLIGLDICPDSLRPWWLLRDAHKTRTGDLMHPAREALRVVAQQTGLPGAGAMLERVLSEYRRRHDVGIHAAAGIPLPGEGERARLDAIDRRCVAIEHRDFHRPSERKWKHELDGIAPGRGTIRKFEKPDRVADQLDARFRRYLPRLAAAEL